jgi:hypothetical protein
MQYLTINNISNCYTIIKMGTALIILLCFTAASGQDKIINRIDKQINDINSQSFKLIYTTNKDDLLELSKTPDCVSLLMCTEQESQKGKDIMLFKYSDTTRVETYYSLKKGLIAIEEEIITFGHKRTSVKYYFDSGKLYKAFNDKGREMTHEIDKTKLYDRIKRYYHEGYIIN